MRHRKKNLTLAKTLSVHKLNCALQRKSQLIGSFASDKKSPKLCHRESSSRVLILPQELTFRIHREATLPSLPKVWDHQKETYTEATKTKTSSFGEQDGNTEHDIDGRKMITLQHSTKATMPNIHNFSSDKTILFLDRKSMVKSSHQ